MAKILLFLRAAADAETELLNSLCDAAGNMQSHPGLALRIMHRLEDDPLANRKPPHHPADVIVEIKAEPGQPLKFTHAALAALLHDARVDRKQSLALTMHERLFRPSRHQAICYHYLMLRRPDFSTADYCDYYVNHHSHFGMITPGIEGYSQNYIDQEGSQQLAAALGVSYREVTSISEMQIASMEKFLASPAMAEIGPEASEDEQRFVDRDQSVMFSSRVVLAMETPTCSP